MNTSETAGSLAWQSRSLPGRPARLEDPLAGGLAGLAGGHPGGGRLDRLAHDLAALVGVAVEPGAELVGHGPLDEALDLGVAELGLGLALELRLAELDGDDGGQALADVVAGEVLVLVLELVLLAREVVDELGQRRAEALLVGAALVGVDGVGVGVHRLGVGGGPLHRELEREAAGLVLDLDGDDVGVHRVGLLGADEVGDVVDEAVVVAVGHRARGRRAGLAAGILVLVVLDDRDVGVDAVEVGLAAVGGGQRDPLVDEVDPSALVEEGVLLEPGADRLVVVVDGLEDLGVGPVGDRRAGAVGLLHLLEGPAGTPWSNDIRKAWPFWRTQTSSRVDRALTTEEPTPCRPPETL